jgi:dTDP-4-amino-4,6-dideoxygalactose transaminase
LDIEQIDRLNILRNTFMGQLEERGVATRQGTHAVHTLGYYKNRYNLGNDKYLQSYAADRLSVALPIYAEMKDADMELIVSTIKDYFKGK